jgi:uncharacterized protein YidB (DUF937 family)
VGEVRNFFGPSLFEHRQTGGAAMGLLDSIFSSGDRGSARGGGGPSLLTLGLLALLAYRTYQGKGRLADILGRSSEPATAGASNSSGQVADPTRIPSSAASGAPAPAGGGLGDLLRGGLGGLLGGAAAGTVLNGGLGDLLRRLQQNGLGEAADTWVQTGPNRRISPQDLEAAVGREDLQILADQSGRPYLDVLSELSESLPDTVDRLTPEGRLPTEDEARRWV